MIPCSELSFCSALMLQRRAILCTGLPAIVPFLTVVCSLLLSAILELCFHYLPVSAKKAMQKGSGCVPVLNQQQIERETHMSQLSVSKDGMAPTMAVAVKSNK